MNKKQSNHKNNTYVEELRVIRLVKDFGTMRKFYEEIFSWPVIDEWEGGVKYDMGSGVFELIQEDQRDLPNDSTRIALMVSDVWTLFEELKDKVDLVFPLRDNSWGDSSFRFTDPEGFPITLFTLNP